MGQSSHSIRETSGGQQSERRHGQSSAALSYVTPQHTSLLAFDWEPTYVSLISVSEERPLTQEDCAVCHAEGQRSLCEASQPERPGVASDGKGGHPGVERAVRPA